MVFKRASNVTNARVAELYFNGGMRVFAKPIALYGLSSGSLANRPFHSYRLAVVIQNVAFNIGLTPT